MFSTNMTITLYPPVLCAFLTVPKTWVETNIGKNKQTKKPWNISKKGESLQQSVMESEI